MEVVGGANLRVEDAGSKGDLERVLIEGVGVDGYSGFARRPDAERDSIVPARARNGTEGSLLVSAKAEVEREGVTDLQQPGVGAQAPRLDGGGPFGIAADAIDEQLLKGVLFGNEPPGFFEFLTLRRGPIGGGSEERVEERGRILGLDAGSVQPVGMQADEQRNVRVALPESGYAQTPALEAVRL